METPLPKKPCSDCHFPTSYWQVPTMASRLRANPQNPAPYHLLLTVHTPATLVSLVLGMFLSSFRIWLPATSLPEYSAYRYPFRKGVPIPFQFFFKSKLSMRFTLITLLNTATAHCDQSTHTALFFFIEFIAFKHNFLMSIIFVLLPN